LLKKIRKLVFGLSCGCWWGWFWNSNFKHCIFL